MAENDKNKKDLKKKEKKPQIPESELEKMLKQVEEQFGVDRRQVRIVRVNTPPNNFKSAIIDIFLTTLLNVVLILSITGFIPWANDESILNLVFFSLAFSAIELILKYLIYVFFKRTVIRTFGLILSLATLLAIPLVLVFVDFVEVVSVQRFLLMFVILIFIRSTIKSYFTRQKLDRFLKQRGRR